MNITNPMGWLVFQIFGALAEYERDRIRERTMADQWDRTIGVLSGRIGGAVLRFPGGFRCPVTCSTPGIWGRFLVRHSGRTNQQSRP